MIDRPSPAARPLLFVGFVVTGFVTTVLGPVLPWLTLRWGLSDAAAGALFTIQFTGSVIAGALSGLVVARVGTSATLSSGYSLMALGFAGLSFGDRLVGTLAIAVAGIGLGLVVPTTNMMVARLAPERAAAALGGLNLCWGIGAATWPLLVARFHPAPGIGVALLAVSILLLAVAVGMGFVHFPAHLLGHRPDAPTPSFSWSRLTIYGLCIALYSGIESAFGGWITEFARRSTANPASLRWETAASAFWGGLAAGRGLVAVVLRQRFETAALFGGLGIVAAALTSLIVMSSSPPVFVVAVACGLGMAPSFPVTMASLSRKVPPRVGQPMIALGSLGAAVVPWIVGAISTRTGSLASGLSALVGLLAVLVGLQVMRVSVSRQSSVVSRQS